MSKTHEGGCLCGAIRFRIDGEPRVVSHCHCSLCRRVSGAPFVTWLTVRKDKMAITGDLLWYGSSDWGSRGFCPACGTHLVGRSEHYERYWDITAGSLDTPECIRPERHVFAGDKVAWLDITDTLPAHVGDATTPLVSNEQP
jgi:hypothetical protein